MMRYIGWARTANGQIEWTNEDDFSYPAIAGMTVTLWVRWSHEMVWVAGGSFELGKNLGTGGGSDVTPVSTVTLTGFWMGKFQVTQDEWQEVMAGNANGISAAPSHFSSNPASGEAQWEYAAKGGDPTAAGWVGYTYAGSNNGLSSVLLNSHYPFHANIYAGDGVGFRLVRPGN